MGVQGDQRTYTPPAVLWETPEDWNWLEEHSIRITNSVREINRVVLLLSPAALTPLKIREAYCTRERLDLLRQADAIATKTLMEHDLMRDIFQLLVILLPISEDGKGDSIVLRPVCSEDVMTAQFARLDWDLLNSLKQSLSNPAVLWETPEDWNWLEQHSIRITNSVREINRVVLLLSPAALTPLKIREAYCTRERLDLLRQADAIATKTLMEHDLMRDIFQLLVILLPISEDGKGDSIVLRPVCSEDVMTAQFARLDWDLLNSLKQSLSNLPGIDAVFYDITHKPPATFGWE